MGFSWPKKKKRYIVKLLRKINHAGKPREYLPAKTHYTHGNSKREIPGDQILQ